MNKERRLQIKQTVLNALKHSQSQVLPVPIKKITKSYKNIRLIPYSKHMKVCNLTYEEICSFAETMDACTDYIPRIGKYLIYYNDVDKIILDSNRYRWNIAHELGHILLNHHKENDKTRIFRNQLSTKEYNQLEEEADYFASLILVPYAPLTRFIVRDIQTMQSYFKISKAAAGRRLYDFNMWKRHLNPSDSYDNAIFNHYRSFIFKRKCLTCGAALIQSKGNYCPICGQKTLKWGDGNMIYKETIRLDLSGKAIRCPVCDNEQIISDGEYCHICGTYLINKCDNRHRTYNQNFCGKILPPNARYCPYCGNKSTFFNDKVLKSWEEEEEYGHLPFD